MTETPSLSNDILPTDEDDVVFDAPWQARAFGLVVALCDQGERDWETFQRRLVERLDGVDPDEMDTDIQDVHYREWLAALEALLFEEGVCTPAEIDRRQSEFSKGERDAAEFVSGDAGR